MNRSKLTGFAKQLIHHSGSINLVKKINPKPNVLRMLCYHSVADQPDYCPLSIAVKPELFDLQMQFLAENYSVLSIDDAIESVKNKSVPERAVVITFDDGFKDNYENALPIIKKYGLTATFYITSNPIKQSSSFWVSWMQIIIANADPEKFELLGKQFSVPDQVIKAGKNNRQELTSYLTIKINQASLDKKKILFEQIAEILQVAPTDKNSITAEIMMDEEDVKKMTEQGMTIGSHTVNHPILTSLNEKQILTELVQSKNQLEEITGQTVKHFAHPNGPGGIINYSELTANLIEQVGYDSSCTSIRGMISEQSNCYLLPRLDINDYQDEASFAFKLEEHYFSSLLLN